MHSKPCCFTGLARAYVLLARHIGQVAGRKDESEIRPHLEKSKDMM